MTRSPSIRERLGVVVLLVVAAVGMAIGCSPRWPEPRFVEYTEEFIAEAHGGSLYRSGTLSIVRVSGPPYERGLQYGALLRDEIAEMPHFFLSCLAQFAGRNPQVIYSTAVDLARNLPKAYLEEMRGVSDGAGISLEDVLFINLYLEALSVVPFSVGNTGCSQFVAVTGEGVVHGRNLDLDAMTEEFLQEHTILLVIHPEDDLAHVSLTFSGMTCAFTGFNREGLVVAANALMGAEGLGAGFPVSFFGREVLGGCSTLDAVAAYLGETQLLCGAILVASDSAGGSVSEIMPLGSEEPRMIVSRGTAPGWVAATNHSTTRDYGEWMRASVDESAARYSILEEQLLGAVDFEGTTVLTRVEAIEVLDRVAQPRQPSIPAATLQSVLFLPTSHELYLSVSGTPATRGTWVHIRFDQLFNPD